MKRFFSLLLIVQVIVILALPSHAAETPHAWYVKRGKNGAIPAIEENTERLLAEYNAYYADKMQNNGDKVLYLTFDAGYENGNVAKVLDILKSENVRAAFFVLSHIVKKEPTLLKRMASEGHLVCNHTAKHPDLTHCSEETVQNEINALEKVYREICGQTLAPFFRPPEGKYNEMVLKTAQNMGYTTVFWSLAYADWNDSVAPNDEKAMSILEKNTHNGAIILLHPTSEINVRILKKMISYWKTEGYRFGTLDELKQR